MSAPKSFATSARRAAGMKKTMEFTIRHDPEDGGQVIEYAFTANTPTEDQLIMFALIDFEDDDEVAHNLRMLFDFLGGILGADGRRRQRHGRAKTEHGPGEKSDPPARSSARIVAGNVASVARPSCSHCNSCQSHWRSPHDANISIVVIRQLLITALPSMRESLTIHRLVEAHAS